MARYRPVYTAIWQDEDEFLKYSDSQKVLFLYLITNEKCTESGIYKISIKNLSFLLGWEPERTAKMLSELKPNIFYDSDSSCIFIKNFYRYNGMQHGRPDLIAKSIAKDCLNFRTPLWDCFIKTYPKFRQSLPKGQRPLYEHEYDNDNEHDHENEDENRVGSGEVKEAFRKIREKIV